jgi:hypothetical protein
MSALATKIINDFETEIEFAVDRIVKEEIEKKKSPEPVEMKSESHVSSPNLGTVAEGKEKKKIQSKVIFFDFTNEFFETWTEELNFPFRYKIINDLKDLTLSLKSKSKIILFLNYSVTPKAVEQLVPQIKVKFPHVKTIVTGHNLSSADITKLSGPTFGAHACLKVPCTVDDVLAVID